MLTATQSQGACAQTTYFSQRTQAMPRPLRLLPNLIGSWNIVGGIARILRALIGHSSVLVPASTPANRRISLRWLAAALSLTADIKTVGANCQDEALRGKRCLWNSKPSMGGFAVSQFNLLDILDVPRQNQTVAKHAQTCEICCL